MLSIWVLLTAMASVAPQSDETSQVGEAWLSCLSDEAHFDYGTHRFNELAEFLGMLIVEDLRVPDEVYDRIVRDLDLLYERYPILRTVEPPSWNFNQMSLGLDLRAPDDGFEALNEFYQVIEVRAILPSHPHWVLVTFCDSLNLNVVRSKYEELPEVEYVDPTPQSGHFDNGDYVDLIREGDLYIYEFSNGQGDCWSGCYCQQTWQFAMTPAGSVSIVDYQPGSCGCGDGEPYNLPNDGDFDGDGVIDCLDPCAADQDEGPVDADGDGVGDLCDGCHLTIPGASVDAAGCPPEVAGDIDHDGDIASDDYVTLQSCMRGPEITPCDYELRAVYLDEDWDVDLRDIAIFQDCFSGTDVPSDANCAP